MRIAVIDCGTNTFNLLIADATPGGWNTVFETKLPVKLGAGGFERREILPSRFVRGLDALYCHQQNLINFECSDVHAIATSAIREAVNGKDFIESVKKLTGIDIRVIDGETEAGYIYKGILQTIQPGKEKCLLMDIGGGSTEFIIADESGILWKKSYLLGVSRLRDMIDSGGRMSHEEISKLRKILTENLADLKQKITEFDCKWLIGSSGSFDTILSLYRQGSGKIDSPVLAANDIDISAIPTLHHWLMNSTLEERLVNPAIPSIRAEYMPIASYLIKFIIELHPFSRLIHSSFSLKEGVMQEICNQIDWSKHKDIMSAPADVEMERPEN